MLRRISYRQARIRNRQCRGPSLFGLKSTRVVLVLLATIGANSAWGVPIRIASFNVKLGIEATTNPAYGATRAVLQRIDADVVGFQELTAETLTNFHQLAAELGYPHVTNSTISVLDSYNTLAVMSRFPLANMREITSPRGAQELFRKPLVVSVDVPNTTNDPTLLVVHHKCCDVTNSWKDRFLRAVEVKRVRDFMQNNQFNANSNVFLLGDFNFVGGGTNITFFNSFPTNIASSHPSYVLGNDVEYPISYCPDPDFYFKSLGMGKVVMRQADGVTTSTFNTTGEVFDFIVTSAAVASRGYQTEIYNSAKDNTTFPGMPKAGSALGSTTSVTASDHFPVFGDFELDGSTIPTLLLFAAPDTITEDGATNGVTLTIRVPQAPGPGESVTVYLDNSAPGELTLSASNVTFTEGVTAIDVFASPVKDNAVDGDKFVTVIASANGYAGASTRITVTDSDYGGAVLISKTGNYAQNFNSLPSSGSTSIWRDKFTLSGWYAQRAATNDTIAASEGGSSTGALYSFGTAGSTERALGSLGSSGIGYAYGLQFQNATTRTVTVNLISFAGEQWRVGQGVTNVQTLDLFYRKSNTEMTNLSPGTNNTGWTRITALTFNSLTNSTSATNASYGKIDGNLPEHRLLLSNNPGLTMQPGEFLMLRWSDIDHAGYDHGLAIDDLTVSWSVEAAPPDLTPPVITLNGSNPFFVPIGVAYSDPGATAFDVVDGSIAVQTDGAVDTSVRGTNPVIYTVIDAAGNTATVTRTVVVRSLAAHFFETQCGLYGSAASLAADADNDGAANVLEYALGSDPTNAAILPGPAVADRSGEKLRLTAVVRSDDNELFLRPVTTSDLRETWSTNGVSEVSNVDQSGVGTGLRRRIWQVDTPNPVGQFMRVEIVYP